jgi:hypothetical protein
MSRIARSRILGLFIVILLVVLPAAACGGNQTAAAAVNPTAEPATLPPTAVATAAPTAVPTPTPPARFTVVGVEVQSGWRPPTIEEATMQQPSLGGEIPAELQWFVAAARADVGSTGYPDAVVSMVTNQGLVTDENDYRAAVTLTLPDGRKVQARLSGFPTQLNPDGTFKSNYEYYPVPGSVDATRYIWTPGTGGTDAPVELTLVKHMTDTGAALLYWSDVEQSWQPVQGYETNGNVVRVGDVLYQYSREDGSAVSLGGFEGMTSFAVDAQTGAVKAKDVNGAEYTLDAESGQWMEVEQEVAVGSTRMNPDTQITEVYVGNNIFLEAPAHYKPEYVTTTEAGQVYYDAPGLHLYVNETGEWQVRPFEEVPMNGFEVMYGAGGEYTITSDTAKADERRREFFVSWVQSAGNQDYRQEVFGTTTPSDDQVWQYLQEHGLVVTKSFTTPHDDTNLFMHQLFRFAGAEIVGTSIDVNQLGLILVMENEWNSDKHGIQTRVEAMRSASGRLDVKFTPLQFKLDDSGRLYIVIVNKGVPADDGFNQRDFYTADRVFGGHTSVVQPDDPFIITSQVETMINLLDMWQPSHTREYWLYDWVISLEDFNRTGIKAVGSYGAYRDQIASIYGTGALIEMVR